MKKTILILSLLFILSGCETVETPSQPDLTSLKIFMPLDTELPQELIRNFEVDTNTNILITEFDNESDLIRSLENGTEFDVVFGLSNYGNVSLSETLIEGVFPDGAGKIPSSYQTEISPLTPLAFRVNCLVEFDTKTPVTILNLLESHNGDSLLIEDPLSRINGMSFLFATQNALGETESRTLYSTIASTINSPDFSYEPISDLPFNSDCVTTIIGAGISSHSKNKTLATQFMDYTLTIEFQDTYSEFINGFSIQNDFLKPNEEYPDFISKEDTQKYLSFYQELWLQSR